MSTQTQYTNALGGQTSPYLLQHAHNPVQWYPWGETALALAKQQDKPILLSIGYSACHWCHVMAHESFEDSKTAEVMNEWFINIKVDREERPDLDKIYQLAHQLLTKHAGGWPLTLFLTPDTHYPFFGGTYFPPQPRYGMPAFAEVLKQVATVYRQQRPQVEQQSRAMAEALTCYLVPAPTSTLESTITTAPLTMARQEIAKIFETRHGGFSRAPKFPHLPIIEYLLQHYAMTASSGAPDQQGLEMVLFTLKKMAMGGIYDQLGGGFYRYSVDEQWMIPHFEKMLYDHGPFLSVYSQAWQLLQQTPELATMKTESVLFQKIALATADWVLREMRSPEGGFYSSLDADSEGKEGRFYLWTKEQARNLLSNELYPIFSYHCGLTRPANFEGHFWHLHVYHEYEKVAKKYGLTLDEVDHQLNQAQSVLWQARCQRQRPTTDEKILTAWNALMITGLATAGRIFQRPDYIEAATQALIFIKQTLWQNGKLFATCKDGQAHLNAYLDDYAFLLEAVLTLLQVRWREDELTWAIQLAEVLLTQFEDVSTGGFYFTTHDHDRLIFRTKSFADDSLPAGNGVAALALIRLGHLIGDTRYLVAAEKTLQAAWPQLTALPSGHATLLLAVMDYLSAPATIVLRGNPELLPIWQAVCQQHYVPQRLCFAIPNQVTELPPGLMTRHPQGDAVAYICQNFQCSAPITELDELKLKLGS